MAIGYDIQFELRTTGADTNGGGSIIVSNSPPAAPSLSTANGTAALNTYYVVVTYIILGRGETRPSAETSITLPDATHDAIVVTAPAVSAPAFLYRVYIGTTSGGPYWLQNGDGTPIGTDYTLTTTPVTSGTQAPGTDYSQQDAAQWGTSALSGTTGSTTVTDATATFTKEAVGNLIHINSGTNFTAGWYRVVAFTDANNLILDRTPCPSGNGSVGVYSIGGAMRNLSTLFPQTPPQVAYRGNTVWIKKGTFDEIATCWANVGGLTGLDIRIIGYNAAHGDDPSISSGNQPHINLSVGSFTSRFLQTHFQFRHLKITTNTAQGLWIYTNAVVDHCEVMNTGTGYAVYAFDIDILIKNSSFRSVAGTALYCDHDYTQVINNYIHDSVTGLYTAGDSFGMTLVVGNIFYNNTTTDAYLNSAFTYFLWNTIHKPIAGGTGIRILTDVPGNVIKGNIISGKTTGMNIINSGYNYYLDEDYNDFWNCTTDYMSSVSVKGANDTALDPQFTDPAGGDFSIGANLSGKGWPATWDNLNTIGTPDIGAVQRAAAGAGGGGYLLDGGLCR